MEMSAARSLLSEDTFLCPVCLDTFTDPVSTPCGHNFCKTCISENWNTKDQYLCPLCKEDFSRKPNLKVNMLLSGMVAARLESSSSSEHQESEPGEVLCDACTSPKLTALKSCMDCLVSYCEAHLEPHLTAPRLKRHQLMDPVENLEDRMCTKHEKPLELFCQTDQTCVCMLCSVLDHKNHEFVPLKDEYREKKAELEEKDAKIQQMIDQRRLKIQEIEHSVHLSKDAADREIAEGVRVFTALKESAERGQAELINTIQKKQETTEKQAEAFIQELEQEISELMKRSAKVEQLSRSKDHLHLIRTAVSLSSTVSSRDWTKVTVPPPLYDRTVVKAVAQLEETLREEMKKLDQIALRRLQQYAVDVTLDPDSAHAQLLLSDDGKQVRYGDLRRDVPSNPKRFSSSPSVLGNQSFSSGQFYYEVQVTGKTGWDLGVARDFSKRKGTITLSPQRGFWTLGLRNGHHYEASADPINHLPLESRPEKIGVFVDYDKGLVSFYDVNAAALIHSYRDCSFTRKLYPYFSPCGGGSDENSAPMIIS
ncbi:E3 ubiquitin-protein ligase TRIM21-like [Cheilinus undulatus]|uniref:E3 ubiquitin-protein ligase TRIM21-like n=1 Tax=Cheilinus undulatus TaxID=241271 RepID=UPI001BD25FDB|nr:E3 ubiquitin-protein ligase TRIM21-like [Cheilinus undulatus]